MNKLKIVLIHSLIFLSGVLAGCSDKIAGAGSETTNGVVGYVVSEDGVSLADVTVKLLASDYNPANQTAGEGVLTTVTGADGRFQFKKIQSGHYAVIARAKSNTLCGRIPDVQVPSEDSMVNVFECKLTAPGTVVIDFSKTAISSGYCYLPGTDIFSSVDSSKKVYLHNVPKGVFDSLIYVSIFSDECVIKSVLAVASQETVLIDNPGWKNSRTLVLNTTSTGALPTNDLFDIPVLLRLTVDNFDFTDAGAFPADLWFCSGEGRSVPFEIEFWDPSNKNAAIWLRIDTLHANSTTQTITMNWGNIFPFDSGKIVYTVFDTASGFQGVWHLSDSLENDIKDATQNSYYGTFPDTARPNIAIGIIGNCRSFDGKRSYIAMPNTASGKLNFSRGCSYTISVWVYIEGIDDKSHVIVSKGNTQYFLWHTPIHLSKPLFEFADFRDQSGWDLAVSDMTTGSWTMLTGVNDGTTHKLYVNGVCTDTLIDYPFVLTRNEQFDLMIGRYSQEMASPNKDEGYCFFNGKIDEVQISSVARSAEWIWFAYESQMLGSKLIIIK